MHAYIMQTCIHMHVCILYCETLKIPHWQLRPPPQSGLPPVFPTREQVWVALGLEKGLQKAAAKVGLQVRRMHQAMQRWPLAKLSEKKERPRSVLWLCTRSKCPPTYSPKLALLSPQVLLEMKLC